MCCCALRQQQLSYFALEEGLECPKIVLISIPVDLTAIVREAGERYGTNEPFINQFVLKVSDFGAPYYLDKEWKVIAEKRTEKLLLIHAKEDYHAPVKNAIVLSNIWPKSRIEIHEHGTHNSILNSGAVIKQITEFITGAPLG